MKFGNDILFFRKGGMTEKFLHSDTITRLQEWAVDPHTQQPVCPTIALFKSQFCLIHLFILFFYRIFIYFYIFAFLFNFSNISFISTSLHLFLHFNLLTIPPLSYLTSPHFSSPIFHSPTHQWSHVLAYTRHPTLTLSHLSSPLLSYLSFIHPPTSGHMY